MINSIFYAFCIFSQRFYRAMRKILFASVKKTNKTKRASHGGGKRAKRRNTGSRKGEGEAPRVPRQGGGWLPVPVAALWMSARIGPFSWIKWAVTDRFSFMYVCVLCENVHYYVCNVVPIFGCCFSKCGCRSFRCDAFVFVSSLVFGRMDSVRFWCRFFVEINFIKCFYYIYFV